MTLRFFDSWRSGAYTDAIDHLHRYFDYAMEGYGMHQNVKSYHQYALLHLAVLHADFGRFEEAVDAMSECISTGKVICLENPGHGADTPQLERIKMDDA